MDEIDNAEVALEAATDADAIEFRYPAKRVANIWIPEGDRHFEPFLKRSEQVAGAGTYQLPKYRQALAAVTHREAALDIGGHVGLWARVMAQDFREVHSFEPCPPHVECFSLNVAQFSNVTLYECALGDKAGEVELKHPADNTGHSHVVKRGGEFRAPVFRLDSISNFWPEKLRLRIGFIKIDVEGFEAQVLLGAEQTIKRHRPVVLIEQKKDNAERYGKDRYAARDLLRVWGMKELCVMNGDHLMVWPEQAGEASDLS